MHGADLGLHMVELPPDRPHYDANWKRKGVGRVNTASQLALVDLCRRTGHVVQQPILVAEHDRGAHDCRVGERLADEVFPARLGFVELGWRVV